MRYCLKCDSNAYGIVTKERIKLNQGDYAICMRCGEVYEFDENLELLLLEDDAVMEIEAEHPEQFQKLMQLSYSIKQRNQLN